MLLPPVNFRLVVVVIVLGEPTVCQLIVRLQITDLEFIPNIGTTIFSKMGSHPSYSISPFPSLLSSPFHL